MKSYTFVRSLTYCTYYYKYYVKCKENISNTTLSLSSNSTEELDLIDKRIIFLITKGFTSSYAVWSAMKKAEETSKNPKKVLAYKNIHQRTINLAKSGFLEEIKLDIINMHSRRDYQATSKGVGQLISYILAHPEEVQNIIRYMDKFKIDKQIFVSLLSDKTITTEEFINMFLESIKPFDYVPIDSEQLKHLQQSMHDFFYGLRITQRKLLQAARTVTKIEQQQQSKKYNQ